MGRDRPSPTSTLQKSYYNPRDLVGRDVFRAFRSLQVRKFQSTRPRGARRMFHVPVVKHGEFQSTRPRGARRKLFYPEPSLKEFQSTRPRGARPCRIYGRTDTRNFNPRALVGRDAMRRASSRRSRFQSTRPRGARHHFARHIRARRDFNPRALVGRDSASCMFISFCSLISIHAPSWGATRNKLRSRRVRRISIHAPSWGATDCPRCGNSDSPNFNPRALVGRDADPHAVPFQLRAISIHAPSWGATRDDTANMKPESISIHAPSWGATP